MYTIKPIQNANDVKIELNNYFLNSNLQNLEKLLACSLGYELSLTDLQSINFQIKNLSTGKACYQAGIISLDLKYLQTIKNIEQLPKVFIILFHELSHAIAQRCNQIILTTKKNAELYLGEFYVDDIYNILLQQTNSKQQSAGAAYYLYYNCPNEVFARRNSFLMCEQFYKTFLPDCLNMLPTFQQKTSQDLATIYNLHPF